jgi:DNA-binding IclR family transcriptional regulator
MVQPSALALSPRTACSLPLPILMVTERPDPTITLSTLDELVKAVHTSIAQGFAYENEEAEIGVGCIGVLIHNTVGEVVASLSISAPIERRKGEWVKLLQRAAKTIADRL